MLRFVRPELVMDAAVLDRYRAMLSPEERDRLSRLRFEEDRHTRLVAWGSLREVLTEASGGSVAPGEWVFGTNEYGKPPVDFECLHFNISHTRGMIALFVGSSELGVDVEAIDRRLDSPLELAERFFAPFEVAELRRVASAGGSVPDRFFEYWTLKESYIKARGMGLAISLDQFWFVLEGSGGPRIEFVAGFDDVPERWRFRQHWVGEGHLAATCEAFGAQAS